MIAKSYYGGVGPDMVFIWVTDRYGIHRLKPDRSINLLFLANRFAWGSSADDAACKQLGLAILLDYFDNDYIALSGYELFTDQVISQMPDSGWRDLSGSEIELWMRCAVGYDEQTVNRYFPSKWDGCQ